MNIKGGAKYLFWVFLNIIFPEKCYICHNVFDCFLCAKCNKAILMLGNKIFLNHDIQYLYIIFKNTPRLFSIIKHGKYNGREKIFIQLMENALLRFEKLENEIVNIDSQYVIVPVPLHKGRLCERGFNQSKSIAHMIAQKYHCYMDCDILIRKKYTYFQSQLKKDKREQNIKNSFIVNLNKPIPDKVLLVDDVYTTGATLRECANILLKAGVRQVDGLVLCKKDLD